MNSIEKRFKDRSLADLQRLEKDAWRDFYKTKGEANRKVAYNNAHLLSCYTRKREREDREANPQKEKKLTRTAQKAIEHNNRMRALTMQIEKKRENIM